MAKLRCTAQSCMYNNSQYCYLGEIEVSGTEADCSEDTCCSNFYKDIGNARNLIKKQTIEFMDVGCDARSCIHNVVCKCQADYISMSGYDVSHCDETCCLRF